MSEERFIQKEDVHETLVKKIRECGYRPGIAIRDMLKSLSGWEPPTKTSWYQNGLEDIMIVAQEILDEN